MNISCTFSEIHSLFVCMCACVWHRTIFPSTGGQRPQNYLTLDCDGGQTTTAAATAHRRRAQRRKRPVRQQTRLPANQSFAHRYICSCTKFCGLQFIFYSFRFCFFVFCILLFLLHCLAIFVALCLSSTLIILSNANVGVS